MSDADSNLENEATKVSHFELVWSQTLKTPAIIRHVYPGSGTEDNPYIVD
jgi:hypothetical protein